VIERCQPLEAEEWFRVACDLDAENRQLRRWLTNLLLVIATRDDLLELGHTEIAKRWPEAADD
jgi:hypothetical protein